MSNKEKRPVSLHPLSFEEAVCRHSEDHAGAEATEEKEGGKKAWNEK
jgi:hypothetical protein